MAAMLEHRTSYIGALLEHLSPRVARTAGAHWIVLAVNTEHGHSNPEHRRIAPAATVYPTIRLFERLVPTEVSKKDFILLCKSADVPGSIVCFGIMRYQDFLVALHPPVDLRTKAVIDGHPCGCHVRASETSQDVVIVRPAEVQQVGPH